GTSLGTNAHGSVMRMSNQERQPEPAADMALQVCAVGLPCSKDDGRRIARVLRPSPQLELDFDAPYKAKVKEWLLRLLRGNVQPGATEVLVQAETVCGWQVRHLLLGVIQELRDDRTVQSYLRQYLKDTLTDDAVQQALRGEAKANDEYQSTLD